MENDDMKNELDKIPRKFPMEAPKGYFDQFPRQMQNVVASQPVRQKYSFSPQLAWAVPSVLILLVGIYFLFPVADNVLDSQQLLAQVSEESLLEYLQESGMDWADYDIAFSESDLDEFFHFDSELMEEELNQDLFLDAYFED